MIRTSSLYETCHGLFAGYPLAVVDEGDLIRSMVLILRDGEHAEFFVLLHECREDKSLYSLCPWPAGGIVDIEADGSDPAPDVAVDVMAHGVPIPRHGSLFGWSFGNGITALVPIYAEYSPADPQPRWSVMPIVGSPEAQWPPFTGEHLLGRWFWEHYHAGRIISLTGLIAGTQDTVFWVNTRAILGSDCCIVANNVKYPEGPMLGRGRYVYHEALRAGMPVPSLRTLLSDTGKIDLAPRFRQFEHIDARPSC